MDVDSLLKVNLAVFCSLLPIRLHAFVERFASKKNVGFRTPTLSDHDSSGQAGYCNSDIISRRNRGQTAAGRACASLLSNSIVDPLVVGVRKENLLTGAEGDPILSPKWRDALRTDVLYHMLGI